MDIEPPLVENGQFLLGPAVFDELGGRHQMRISQEVAKGETFYAWGVHYGAPGGMESTPYLEAMLSGPMTCEGDSLRTLPGTQIDIGPNGDVAILFGATNCAGVESARIILTNVMCGGN